REGVGGARERICVVRHIVTRETRRGRRRGECRVELSYAGNVFEKHAIAAADRPLAGPGRVPGKADARRYIVVVGFECAVRHTRVPLVNQTDRRVRAQGRCAPGPERAEQFAVQGLEGSSNRIAYTEIERQVGKEAEVILPIELVGASRQMAAADDVLAEVRWPAKQEIGKRNPGELAVEGELATHAAAERDVVNGVAKVYAELGVMATLRPGKRVADLVRVCYPDARSLGVPKGG